MPRNAAPPRLGAPPIDASAANPAPPGQEIRPGEKIDHFVVDKQIGAGGSSLVFRAKDPLLGRYVAIKQVMIDGAVDPEAARHAVRREAESHKKAAAADPNLLVQFIALLDDPRGLLLITEYVHGWSLEQRLQAQTGPLGVRDALGLLAGTAKALSAIHGAGVLHRDLKPSNLLLPKVGGLKVADFGLAAAIAEQDAMDVGSVRYMAPELLQGETGDPRSDLYALGMIGYEMFAGRAAFDQAFRSVLRDRQNRAQRWMKWHTNTRAKATPLRELNPNVPEPVAELVERLMEKEPTRRPGTADDVLAAIRRSLAQDAVGADDPAGAPGDPRVEAGPAQPAEDTAALPKKSKLPWVLGGIVAVWLIAGGVFFAVMDSKSDQAAEALQTQREAELAEARRLRDAGQWAASRDAFANLRDQLTPGTDGHALTQAGFLHASAWAAFEAGDYVEASRLSDEYRAHPQAQTDRSLRLQREVAPRAAFAKQLDDVEKLIAPPPPAKGPTLESLESAEQRLRRVGDNRDSLLPEEQTRLATAETRLADARIALTSGGVLAEARRLWDQSRREQAIRYLTEQANRRDGPTQAEEDLLAEYRSTQALELALGRAEVAESDAVGAETRAARIARLQEALSAWQAVVAISDNPAAHQARRDDVRAKLLFLLALDAEDAGKIDDAIRLVTDSNRIAPDPDKQRKLGELAVLRDRERNLAEARRLAAQGQFDEARRAFERLGVVSEVQRVDAMIARRDGTAAFAAGDIDGAFDLLTRAQELGLADDDALQDTLAAVVQQRSFEAVLAQVDQDIVQRRFREARLALEEAEDAAASDAQTRRIAEKKIDIEYTGWFVQGQDAEGRRDWDSALIAYRRAQEQRDTEAVRARIAGVQREQVGAQP
ncbi:MAG: protein kinase [Planctomycetota bacterium]